MKRQARGFVSLCLTIISLALAGCGSGGGSASSTALTGPAASAVTGVAAAGAPLVGTASIKDSSTPTKERTTTLAADGSYVFNVEGLTAPFILRAQGTAGGTSYTLYSFATTPGTSNTNPLSNVAVANAAGVSDPGAVYATPNPAALRSIADNIPAAVTALQTKLKPLLDQFGANVDPISAPFVANHTGLDAVLDAVSVQMGAGNVTVVNKSSNAAVFSAPLNNIGGGTFNNANMPIPSQQPGPPAVNPPATPAPAVDGAALYASKCAGCHGPLGSSNKKGATASLIQAGITGNIGGMGSLSTLTATEIQAIATALGAPALTPSPAPAPTPTPSPSPSPTPAPADGAALYASKCAGCHGQLANSSKAGATIARIQTAINGNIGGMGFLSTLTSAEIQAIASALGATTPAPSPSPTPAPTPSPSPTPTPSNGATLYTNNCSGCHGQLATSSKIGATTTRIQTAINGNVGGMGSLSGLTATDIQAIAAALAAPTTTPTPAPTPADGLTMYNS